MSSFQHSRVKWGILGAGNVCEVKSAPAMQKISKSELVAVMRRTTYKAKDYAERHQVPKWYDDADDLLADPGINAVYIATPPNVHAELTHKAASLGKAVYVEKPMARSFEECQTMIESCVKADVPLYVAYYSRALPNFLKIKTLIDQGAIGDVRAVHIKLYQALSPDIGAQSSDENWRVKPEISGGGYFYDLASHQLDFLDFVLGPINCSCGASENQTGLYPANDIVTANFEFENSVLGTGSWCFNVDLGCVCDKTIIIGSKGKIVYPTFDGSFVELTNRQNDSQIFEFDMPEHVQQPFIQSIVNDLLGKESHLCNGTSAARTNRVMEDITH